MTYVLRFVELVGISRTGKDVVSGKFLRSYDPARNHLDVVSDPSEAYQFPNAESVMATYRTCIGTRADGRPDRPLTAYTVEVLTYEDALRNYY